MKTVFIDIDSQLDFLYPAGALYVPHAERIVPVIARLNRFAAAQGMPVISTADAHTEDDPEFQVWPHHCVAGTWGQRKPESTLLARRVVIPNRECELGEVKGAQQVVVEKQTVDAFRSANLGRVLEALAGERYVVYGVVTEICVFYAVRGLLETGRPVIVVSDAVETLKAADGQKAIGELVAGGAMLAPAAEICGG
ncbi:MAG TPA: isochorismatase family cysteine hydrolase [Bryobacteraceae bacterium]|nr:isochorismatase family cysteine hydrolase [Bryobacteraceae bacterium]